MSKERIFKELIAQFASDGIIDNHEYALLLEKGKDMGFDKTIVDLLIKMELSEFSSESYDKVDDHTRSGKAYKETYRFVSAFTRGGSIITPDIIIIEWDSVTYVKRNKYLINTDSISVPISKISSVEIDTGLLGTDIIIKTFGSGEIIGRRFTKSDARKIKQLIQERQG
jgi:hypothetical protein